MPHVGGRQAKGSWEQRQRLGEGDYKKDYRLLAGRGAAKQWWLRPFWKLKARKNSLLVPQGGMLSSFPGLLSQSLSSHSAGSGKSNMKALADLPSTEVCLLAHEWCLSAMSSLGGHGQESFGDSFIKVPRDEAPQNLTSLKGPHGSVPSP